MYVSASENVARTHPQRWVGKKWSTAGGARGGNGGGGDGSGGGGDGDGGGGEEFGGGGEGDGSGGDPVGGGGDGDGGGSLHKVHWLAMVEGAPVRGDRSADV